jgi:hypothetical protein
MLDGSSIRTLSAWCGVRDLSWSAAHSIGDCDVMMLRPRDAGRPWQSMRLVLDGRELRLENELGETLATASSLPALLDAVDGGVAEPPTLPARVLAGLLGLPSDPLRTVVL